MTDLHGGHPSMEEVSEQLMSELTDIPELERNLEQLLVLQGDDPERHVELKVPFQATTVPVPVPVKRLVEAKRSEIGRRMDTVVEATKALAEACNRVLGYTPEPAADPEPAKTREQRVVLHMRHPQPEMPRPPLRTDPAPQAEPTPEPAPVEQPSLRTSGMTDGAMYWTGANKPMVGPGRGE